jgi:hypothetical protein
MAKGADVMERARSSSTALSSSVIVRRERAASSIRQLASPRSSTSTAFGEENAQAYQFPTSRGTFGAILKVP